jgi:hypothetical protein
LVDFGVPVEVDGLYGPATQDAVSQFQAQMTDGTRPGGPVQLLAVDGIAGPLTIARLKGYAQNQEIVTHGPARPTGKIHEWGVLVCHYVDGKTFPPCTAVVSRKVTRELRDGQTSDFARDFVPGEVRDQQLCRSRIPACAIPGILENLNFFWETARLSAAVEQNACVKFSLAYTSTGRRDGGLPKPVSGYDVDDSVNCVD